MLEAVKDKISNEAENPETFKRRCLDTFFVIGDRGCVALFRLKQFIFCYHL